jgi:tRNA (guanine-N(7)-)-methyltransferase subunit TRM82
VIFVFRGFPFLFQPLDNAMKFPYSQVYVHDGIIFAAHAGRIESFDLYSRNHVSTWTHPDTETFIASSRALREKTQAPIAPEAQDQGLVLEPPAKRQKTFSGDEGEETGSSKTTRGARDANQPKGSGKKGAKSARPVERPLLIQITGTKDGGHVVAVSGHDKAIWVFEHTGAGQLRQISKRSALTAHSPFFFSSD